jgi:methionine-S-sulfoxide reductase
MTSKALFAAGCFWGVQYYFDEVPGVFKSTAGYSGGKGTNPTWESTHGSDRDHAECVLLEFDTQTVSYETLVRHFFRLHNPTQKDGQGPNIGTNYRSAVFYFDEGQKTVAEKVRSEIQAIFNEPVVTEITPAGPFYEAEAFHQKYTEKTGRGMCHVAYEPLKK